MAKPSKPPKHWPTPKEPATDKTAREHRLDLALTVTPADPTVGAYLQEALGYLEAVFYALYQRQKAALEGGS